MPELPEVETIRLGLSKLLPGKRLSGVKYDWKKTFPNAEADVKQFLINAKIAEVKRRAKVLLIELSSMHSLVIHLKMTGQLVYVGENVRFGAGHPNDSLISELPNKTTRVTFDFTDESKLFFNDQRKFGWIKLLPTSLIEMALTGSTSPISKAELESDAKKGGTDTVIDFLKKVGPEPLTADFTAKIFRERLARRKNTSIKAALLDQTVIAGVGNIYADEALWSAKIYPAMIVQDIPIGKLNKLFHALQTVLNLSIEKGGSTDKNYVDAEGKKGSYLTFANVFRRDKQPCTRCGTTIEKLKVAGRGTHICPRCQQSPQS